jgi:hypothetical protein
MKFHSRYVWTACGTISAAALGFACWSGWLTWQAPNAPRQVSHSTPSSTHIHPGVAALLSKEPTSLAARLNHLYALGDRLTQDDRLCLLSSITNEPLPGISEGEWHSLANDIMMVLRWQKPYMPEYTEHLIALWENVSINPTLRDYALQHLREWVSDGDSRSVHEERPDHLARINATFVAAVSANGRLFDRQSTTTGTALLALDAWLQGEASLSLPNQKSYTAADFQKRLIELASDASIHRGTRATALQLCSHRRLSEVLPLARTLLASVEAEAIMKISAISLLGTLGNDSDLTFLRTYQDQLVRDPMLHSSLQKAIQSLSSRP